MRVLGISGSLRRDSHNRRLLRAAADLLPSGVELVEFDGLKAIPAFDEDEEHTPGEAVAAWREALEQADVVLFATPEYNSSIPGVLKNAVDWASRPVKTAALRNKPVAVVGASTGMFGAVWAQAELRKVLAAAGARVIDRELPVPAAHEAFDDAGRLVEAEHHDELASIVEQLLSEAQPRLVAAA
ncbi:MAG: NAD(P)H-dependent oxidoreductase [Solirubrobacterales bacterium]|jgi:chromate reductase|nr:NAD(P)H-dependent oxidoreductase [Solirubrobacterales bacterium]